MASNTGFQMDQGPDSFFLGDLEVANTEFDSVL